MKLTDINAGASRIINTRFLAGDEGPFDVGDEVTLRPGPGGKAAVMLSSRGTCIVDGVSQADVAALEQVLGRGLQKLACLMEVPDAPSAGGLRVKVSEFAISQHLGAYDIGIDDASLQAAASLLRSPGSQLTVEAAVARLNEEFLLPHRDGETRAFGLVDQTSGALALVGTKLIATLQSRRGPDGERFMTLESLRRRVGEPEFVALLSGEIAFIDNTRSGRLRAVLTTEIERIGNDPKSYLRLWDQYGQHFESIFRERAAAVGCLKYDGITRLSDHRYQLTLTDKRPETLDRLSNLKKDDGLVVAKELSAIAPASAADEGEHAPRSRRQQRIFANLASDIDPKEASLIVKVEDGALPDQGFVAINTLGDEAIVRRRQAARAMLANGRSAMPTLGLLVEGAPFPPARFTRVPGITERTRRKIFVKNPATSRQAEAIEVALNTPDIALIQGPPGTGKTTVITAIVERLNEMLGRDGHATGEILVSGFQHDAVKNAISRIEVMGLPTPKFGGKRKDDEEDVGLEAWTRRLIEDVRTHTPSVVRSERHAAIQALIDSYAVAPWPAERVPARLRELACDMRTLAPGTLAEELDALARDIEETNDRRLDATAAERLRAVWGLRCAAVSFMDDGPSSAYRLAKLLPVHWLDEGDTRTLLDQASTWSSPVPPPFLPELSALRRRLLKRLSVPPPSWMIAGVARRDLADLLLRVSAALDSAARVELSPVDRVLGDYVQELSHSPTEVTRTIRRYTTVFGATCQQAEGSDIKAAKVAGAVITYDTVLVDEAARANPLDLMVPMVQARRRIILVGDHKQLPHLIEDAIADRIDADCDVKEIASLTSGDLKQSLFERLFTMMSARERTDNVRRTVTLNEQYRMHPTLGDFVSRSFYNGEVRSPLPAHHFAHELTGLENQPAAWLRVPTSEGLEDKEGHSRRRRVEARSIAVRLKAMLDDPAGLNMSFGVISFYSAQVKAVHEALCDVGVMMRFGRTYRLKDAYAERRDAAGRLIDHERLLVGTVDAFQGREFDVVFLSVVRANRLPDSTETQRIRKYGHLMSANRLCVSMSRQRRLLVVTGDPALVSAPCATDAIGPLVDFYRMCEQHGTLL